MKDVKTLDDYMRVYCGDLDGAYAVLKRAADLECIEIRSGNGSFSMDKFNMAYGLKSRGCSCVGGHRDRRINISNHRGSVMLSRWSSDSPFADKIGESVPLTLDAALAAIRWLAGVDGMQPRGGPYG